MKSKKNISYKPTLVYPVPYRRSDEEYLDGSIDYVQPTKSLKHNIIENEFCWGNVPNYWSFYNYIAMELVTESVFHYPYPFISEKTIKPILNYRMFIIAGPVGTLQTLKNKGFHTWSDIIDESYDIIEDPTERLKRICQSLNDFCNLDINQVIEYLKDNKKKLIENADNLELLKQQELANLCDRLSKD